MIKFVNKNKNFQLIIRSHPAEKSTKLQKAKTTIQDNLKEKFGYSQNVKISPESNISSYSLSRIANANLVWNSTIGLEIALKGIKPFVVAEAYYAIKALQMIT